jgi:pSer/pThr/pTyr-binding forkhead associated (FHA) protein
LEVQTGSSAGQQIVVRTGESVTIGRVAPSDFAFPDDTHMSSRHFRVECSEHTCTLRDLKSSNGTLLNGHGAAIALLRNGDTVLAGNTSFSVQTAQEGAERSPATVVSSGENATPQDRLLSLFRNEFQPLYALLDAAVEPSILKVLRESKEEYQSLYQGSSGAQLVHFAPYLVRLPKDSPLLETIVQQGWGKNWGVYLICDQPLEELRKHFRHFLMVRMPDGKQVYFRFYDPRVLRAYLPTCLPVEIEQFFGPVKHYITEDINPNSLLQFSDLAGAAERKVLQVSGA